MNNEKQNLQNEIRDDELGGVTGGNFDTECYKTMRCMDCKRDIYIKKERVYSYGNAGVVCSKCEEKREKARNGLL